MKRKKFKIRYAAFMTAVVMTAAFLLTGCLPKGYTKEKREELTETYAPEAMAWFNEKMPDATLNDDAIAHVSGSNLVAAIEGTYNKGGKTYNYLYDYKKKIMYVDELFTEVSERTLDYCIEKVGVDKSFVDPFFSQSEIPVICENDDASNMNTPKGEEYSTQREGLLPADKTADELFEENLKTTEYFTVSLTCYVEEYPEFDEKILEENQVIYKVTYYVPIEMPGDSIAEKDYTKEKTTITTSHFEQLPNGLYAGYVWEGEKEFKDSIECTEDSSGNFTLQFPKEVLVNPIIASEKKLSLSNYFTNSAGKEINNELEEMYVYDCPGHKDWENIEYQFVVKKGKYFYKTVTNVGSGDEYHYR